MSSVLIFIPAYNEAGCIEQTLKGIPQQYKKSIIVVDDGSTDGTGDIAREMGVTVLTHAWNRGLAAAFRTAQDYFLEQTQAKSFVIFDADGQFSAGEIAKIIEPVESSDADIVIGARTFTDCPFMPWQNVWGNKVGSWMIRVVLGVDVHDASCGFRCLSREAVARIDIHSHHTYTHEMLIHAKGLHMRLLNLPITCSQRAHGKSKLVRSFWGHITRSCGTILRSMLTLHPLWSFTKLSFVFGVFGSGFIGASIPLIGSLDKWCTFAGTMFLFASMQLLLVGLIAEVYKQSRHG